MARPAAMGVVQGEFRHIPGTVGKVIRCRAMVARGILLVMMISGDLRRFMRTALSRCHLGHKRRQVSQHDNCYGSSLSHFSVRPFNATRLTSGSRIGGLYQVDKL